MGPCCPRNQYSKNQINSINIIQINVKNQLVLNGHLVSGNDHRVAMLLKFYIIIIGIIMQSLKTIGQF